MYLQIAATGCSSLELRAAIIAAIQVGEYLVNICGDSCGFIEAARAEIITNA